MNSAIHRFKQTALALSVALVTVPAWAVPTLQLDILGGTYDSGTDTIVASSNVFSVFAYLSDASLLADTYFLSAALTDAPNQNGNYGSFSVNGTPIIATLDMVYGTPPLETVLNGPGGAIWDPSDLAKHSIYPTYFKEFGFTCSAAQQSDTYNTELESGSGPKAGTGMYYKRFDIDIGGLGVGRGLHFDLYSEKFNKKGIGDLDIKYFAPFSHDAEAHVMTPIPEPETYAMLLAGLGLMGLVARRRKNRPF